MTNLSRRRFLQASVAALAGTATMGILAGTRAAALGPILGTVVDYSAGVPDAGAIRAAGHLGSVRYVSERRPGANWMLGKPVTLAETTAQALQGLKVASVYQFGRAETADWKQGAAGAATHAPQAIRIHRAAGGPNNRPIYVAIDDNPTRWQYDNQIRPYLQAFDQRLRAEGLILGIYGNYNTIEWAIRDGLGSFFWQHDWGSNGQIHPRTTIHQKAGYRATISGVEVDVNNVYAHDWGWWTPGQAAVPTILTPGGQAANPAAQINLNQLGSSANQLNQLSSQVKMPTQQEIETVQKIVNALQK